MSDGWYVVIRAVWPTYPLDDIGEVVKIGRPLTIEKSLADKSNDLKEAIKLNAVVVTPTKKCANIRANPRPAPPHNRRMKKTPGVPVKPRTVVKEVPVVKETVREVPVVKETVKEVHVAQPAIDEEALIQKMAVAFGGIMSQKLAEQEDSLRREFKTALESQNPQPATQTPDLSSLKGDLQGMLREVVSEVQPSSTQAKETSEEQDQPTFIPSKILSGKTKDTIQVQQSSSTSSGVDDAAARLKALRKKNRNK